MVFGDVLSDSNYLEPIAFEEYRLRRIAGERVTREHYRELYDLPTENWPDLPLGEVRERPLASLGSTGKLSATDGIARSSSLLADSTRLLPDVGDRFLGFELVSELGRGALGRVYLARQGDLARRFVALKITARGCDEAQHLAQLQHSNIVPIYSFHTYDSLQAVCMPFLGRRTLADVVHSFRCGDPFPASGQALIGTLGVHLASAISTDQTAEEQAAAIESQCKLVARTDVVRRMEQMTFIDAAAWIISRVADGLAHAHEHGIVHRDLKPANVLVSDDGEPLILDFHLSAQQPADAVIGGTLPYMSVEQLEALLHGGEIGRKSDIYSLGVILFELLTGKTPYPIRFGTFPEVIAQMLEDRQQPVPSVRTFNKRVSCDLDSIVSRCLAADPSQRYESARQLHEDLACHLAHRSLRYAPNRSLVERSRKWIRRHPRVFSATSMAMLTGAAIVILVASLAMYSHRVARADANDDPIAETDLE
jgi:serine/threonine protein kinase